MIPYSMPLWTIFAKWPAPTVPAWTNPDSPSGCSVSKIGCSLLDRTRQCRPPSGRSPRSGPTPHRRRRSRRSRSASRRAPPRAAGRRCTASCHRRSRRRPARAALPSCSIVSVVGLPAGTITQTARGAVSPSTSSSRLSTSRPESGERSKPTTCVRRGAAARPCCRPCGRGRSCRAASPTPTAAAALPLSSQDARRTGISR